MDLQVNQYTAYIEVDLVMGRGAKIVKSFIDAHRRTRTSHILAFPSWKKR